MSDLTQQLRLDADEIECCGAGNEAANIRKAVHQLERLTEALSPSGDTKAAYMGEFKTERGHIVDWTTIKAIMATIRARSGVLA